jgi:hypothetical protein
VTGILRLYTSDGCKTTILGGRQRFTRATDPDFEHTAPYDPAHHLRSQAASPSNERRRRGVLEGMRRGPRPAHAAYPPRPAFGQLNWRLSDVGISCGLAAGDGNGDEFPASPFCSRNDRLWVALSRPSSQRVGQGASRGAQWTGMMSASPSVLSGIVALGVLTCQNAF